MSNRKKLYPKDKISPSVIQEMDSIRQYDIWGNSRSRGMDVLLSAKSHYDRMHDFRVQRERCKRYTYGDQWGDKVVVDGREMTEAELIKRNGNVPLKNNLIHRHVTSVRGVFEQQPTEPVCIARDRDEQTLGETMSSTLQYNMQVNQTNKLLAHSMEDYLIGGLVVHKKTYGWRRGRYDAWTDIVDPNSFFIDCSMRDIRGWDAEYIGQIHDVSFQAVCEQFAHNAEDFNRIKEIYSYARNRGYVEQVYNSFGQRSDVVSNFMYPSDMSKCRVIEVWRKESKARFRCHDINSGEYFKVDYEDIGWVHQENESRVKEFVDAGGSKDNVSLIEAEFFIDSYWYFYFLSPFGDILMEGETPYKHGEHPYVFSAYPFIDGEIHSFVSNIIDQQRYVNRLVMTHDMIVRSSAKGVLLIPEDSLGGQDPKEFAESWHKFNGVIVYRPKPGVPEPKQVSGNSTNIGIAEMLNLQLRFFEDISGVHGALQGKPGYSGMPASLYAQQSQNATTSLLGILNSYSAFILDGANKDVKLMQQYYTEKRIINIAGKRGVTSYDPEKMSDVDFDLSIVESVSSPVARDRANEFLMQIWQSGQINLEQLLEHGRFDFADQLLQSIKSQRAQIENGQEVQGIDPDIMQRVSSMADQDAVNRAYELLRRDMGYDSGSQV